MAWPTKHVAKGVLNYHWFYFDIFAYCDKPSISAFLLFVKNK